METDEPVKSQFIDAHGKRVGQDLEDRPAGKGTGKNPATINGPVTRDVPNYNRARIPVSDLAGAGGVETVEKHEVSDSGDGALDKSAFEKGLDSAKRNK